VDAGNCAALDQAFDTIDHPRQIAHAGYHFRIREQLNTEYELPESAAAGEIGFAFSNIEVWLPVTGRWVFVVTGGAGVVSLALVVRG
jgi:hypothetical protein